MDLSSGVADISCGARACVARFDDGSATAWGDPQRGGDLTQTDSGRVVDQLLESGRHVEVILGARLCANSTVGQSVSGGGAIEYLVKWVWATQRKRAHGSRRALWETAGSALGDCWKRVQEFKAFQVKMR